jgi:glucan biosynthesis protein C
MHPQQERLHSLDAVRAFALLLGIVLHAAASFVPARFSLEWVVADNSPSYTLMALLPAIHLFRMTLFFFIAGFFAHLSYHRKGAEAFARDRLTRIALPFVVGWCVMTPIIRYLWRLGHQQNGITSEISLWPSADKWASGELSLTHLWFLYYLMVFYVVIVGARHFLVDKIDASGQLRSKMDRMFRKLIDSRWAPVVLSLPLTVAAFFAPEWNPAYGMPNPSSTLIPELIMTVGYGVAFIAGWIFHRDLSLLQLLVDRRQSTWMVLLPAIVLSGLSSTMLLTQQNVAPTFFRILGAFAGPIIMWIVVFAILKFALKKFDNPSPRIRYVADASYWMYIAHLPIVDALQICVANWNVHWSLKFPLIVGTTFAVLLFSYRYLVRYTFIGAVLNGRKYPPSTVVNANATVG